jgi:hypothetical protein
MQTLVPIDTIAQLLAPIKEVVSAPQFVQIERLVRGLLLVDGKCSLEAIRRSLAEHISVGSLNHFLAESPWSDRAVQAQVWVMLQSDARVAPRGDGLLFVDDTLTGEHYGAQMEGLAKYLDVTQPGQAYIYSHCLVNLHYGHELSRRERRQTGQAQGWVEYWLDFRLYRRKAELTEHGQGAQFRTKPQLLLELLCAQDWAQLPVQTIVFDHQYLTPDVVQVISNELQRHWVSKASKNSLAWWRGQWLRLDAILLRLPPRQFQAVWVQTTPGRQRYWVCKRRLRLRTLYQGQVAVSVVFSKTSGDATAATYLVSDHDWSARQIVRVYARRWTIETGHKQEKHLLGVADYQMTRLKTIQRFWRLNLLAYAVLALLRFVSHPLADELVPEVHTLGQARQFLAVLALAGLVTLVITLAQVYTADDIVRRLVKGLDPADLARLARGQPP